MTTRSKRWSMALWAVVPLLLAALPLGAQELSRQQELDRLRLEIRRLQSHLSQIGQERRSLRGELARIDLELELQRVRVEEARVERDSAQAELERLEADVDSLEQELAAARRSLRGVLIRLYRSGDRGALELFLSLEAGGDPLDGIRQLRYLAQRDTDVVREYLGTFERLTARREEVASQAGELERWLGQEQERRDELESLKQRRIRTLAALEREERTVAARAEQLVERERKLEELIDLLAKNRVAPGGAPIERFRGVLDWPVRGRVTTGFGPRLDPRYGTKVPHNGLEISISAPTGVRAIYAGRVLYAAPFEGYGLTVILLHPGRVFSLYAGLSELQVGADDVVSLGDVVGLASTELYFEIRVENRPVDPVDWLR